MNSYCTVYFDIPDLTQLYNMMYFVQVFKKNEKLGFFEFSKKAERDMHLANLKELGIKMSLALDVAEDNKTSRTHIVISKEESDTIMHGLELYSNAISVQETLNPEKNTKEEIKITREGISTIIQILTSAKYE